MVRWLTSTSCLVSMGTHCTTLMGAAQRAGPRERSLGRRRNERARLCTSSEATGHGPGLSVPVTPRRKSGRHLPSLDASQAIAPLFASVQTSQLRMLPQLDRSAACRHWP